MRVIYGQT